MISILYFTKPEGGMHNYAKLIEEGYQENEEKTLLFNYYQGRFDYYKQFICLLFGVRTNIVGWFIDSSIYSSDIIHFTDTPIYLGFFIKSIYNRDTKFIITIHDPNPHPEKGLKLLKYFAMIYLNKQLIRLSKSKNNIFIHVHSEKQVIGSYSSSIFSKLPISSLYSEYKKITSVKKNEPLLVLFIGRLEYYKGVDVFIDSVNHYNRNNKHPNKCKFTLAGKGNLESKSYPPVNMNLINKFLTNEEFINLIENAHLLVFPYRQATQSGVLNMAISLNKPVVVSNVGALSEYVIDKETGILVEELSSEKLAKIYSQLENDSIFVEEMSKNTLKFKKTLFSKKTIAKILDQIKGLTE